MLKLFKNKKLVITLGSIFAVVLVAGIIFAVWHLTKDDGPCTVTFVTNGGNEIQSIAVEKGTMLAQADLPVPSKRGELFLSWNTDAELTKPYWDMPIESDMTLYASYVEPVDEETSSELVESVIPFASTDLSLTVCSSVELTDENVGQYILLTVNYGQHENGEAIKLSVASEGDGIYRISGNYAEGGEYIISLMSDEVTFNPEDETLKTYGLTDALRTLRFRILGESYMDGELSGKVADIPVDAITVKDSDSITVSGSDRNLVGATEEDNGILCVGEGEDISDYYKIVEVETVSDNGITYNVRPAAVDEVYDHVTGYHWETLDPEDYIISEETEAQLIESISNNEQLNNYVKYLAMASTYTPTYKSMSVKQFGEVVATPMNNTVVTPVGVTVGLDLHARNDNFSTILDEGQEDEFVKLTLGITYEIKLAKVGSAGSIVAEINITFNYWAFIGVGGKFDIDRLNYDIDYGTTVLTQTEATFAISLMTSDAKRRVNINDEIEAIYSAANDPTPENLLEQYNELMSGGSKPIELFNKEIFEVPIISLFYGAVEISVPVRFVVSLDVEAAFSSYFTVLTGNDFGIIGKGKVGDKELGLDVYHARMPERYKFSLELRGRIELRAGLEIGIELSFAYDLASVSMNVQTGLYGEIHGYFFYEIDAMNYKGNRTTNMGGAYYFEIGAYVDIRVRAEICHVKYSGSLWDKKFPFFSRGQKEIVYGFVNPTSDIVTIDDNKRSVYFEDTDILDVYVLDITEPRSESNPKIVKDYPYDKYEFEYSFSTDDFDVYQDRIRFVGNFRDNQAFEATMTLKYKGAQLSFRDCLTKKLLVRCSALEDTDWDKIGKTFKVDFTIDGKVIFTREYLYGEEISPNKMEIMYYDGGRLLSDAEEKAILDAGYEEVHWSLTVQPDYVTENLSIEAMHTVYWRDGVKYEIPRKKVWNVTFAENGESRIVKSEHKEKILFPKANEDIYSTDEYQYTFIGWKAENGTLYSADLYHTITSDLTLTPQYSVQPLYCTITFDAGIGGTFNGKQTVEHVFNYGATPYCPTEPTPKTDGTDRYDFVGWSPELKPVTRDMTYVAQWKKTEYCTVTFNAGEGQFDESGKRTVTVMVEKGKALTKNDLPANPYKKGTGGYYEFNAWSSAVSAGTVINNDVTYTASYKKEFVRQIGITISDGVNTEDIAAYLDGKSKVKGYTYTPNTEFQGNSLQITKSGLTVSGSAPNITVTVIDAEVTLHNLTLSQSSQIVPVYAQGKSTLNISGTVKITVKTDREAIRGENSEKADGSYSSGNITLRGVNSSSKLIVNGQAYGIAIYGKLTVDNLDIEITMPSTPYKDPNDGWTYDTVALQVQSNLLNIKNSDIIVKYGVVDAAWLSMTNSTMTFAAEKFTPGTYTNGLHIANWYTLSKRETLITLKNSQISFKNGIAVAIVATVDEGDPEDVLDDTFFTVNTTVDRDEFLSTYKSSDALLAAVKSDGYSNMIIMDGKSSIK